MIIDVALAMGMTLRVTASYMTQLITLPLGPLDLDELNSWSDDTMSLPLKEEDQMIMDNPIHDGPRPTWVLEVLPMVSPTLGKKDSMQRFV